MDAEFWHQKWRDGKLPFSMDDITAQLKQNFHRLGLKPGARVFVPLCGSTLDIGWLLSEGYYVVGAELSDRAITRLLQDIEIVPDHRDAGAMRHYYTEGLEIYGGDIFALTPAQLGKVDAIYDRAALAALPEEIREAYSEHLQELTGTAPQLMICYDYEQELMDGPPFAINDEEVLTHYTSTYTVEKIASTPVDGGLNSKTSAQENVWLLSPL
ncbi:thiopurine S-methyltransferase [Kiloniella sp. b19]|uniref:thiopurine S-methyltransferase n=1 Tax=Kiloniella sp. GXU_MW_B19 TaxID=3141326 RepID=UPI0031D0CEC5